MFIMINKLTQKVLVKYNKTLKWNKNGEAI